MPAVNNKTHKPLSVPLPGGKTLHLGPGKTGQISAKAATDARLLRLVEAGEIEIVDEEARTNAGPTGSSGRQRTSVHRQTTGTHRSGDR